MTANRREADFVWIDEDSDIDYDEVWRTQPRLEAAPIEAASYDVAADGWGTEVRMRREGDGRITVLSTRREPPGLARNRRARERWVDWMRTVGDRDLWRNMSGIERSDWNWNTQP